MINKPEARAASTKLYISLRHAESLPARHVHTNEVVINEILLVIDTPI